MSAIERPVMTQFRPNNGQVGSLARTKDAEISVPGWRESLLVVRFAHGFLGGPVNVLPVALMLLQVCRDVRAMRNDALAGCHHIVQGKMRQHLGQPLAFELRPCLGVGEIDVTGPIDELGNHRQLPVYAEFIAMEFVVSNCGDASSERVCQ